MTTPKSSISIKWEVISFLITICILAACSIFIEEDVYTSLDEKYKIVFKEGDTLNYINQFGDTFQMKIVDVHSYNIIHSLKGSGGPHGFIEQQVVEYDSLQINPLFPRPQYTARSEQSSGKLLWHYRLSNRIAYDAKSLTFKTINGTTYESTFQIDVGAAVKDSDIITWYYTYKYGFVGFQLLDGQLFSLIIP